MHMAVMIHEAANCLLSALTFRLFCASNALSITPACLTPDVMQSMACGHDCPSQPNYLCNLDSVYAGVGGDLHSEVPSLEVQFNHCVGSS